MSLNFYRQSYSKERYTAPRTFYPIDLPGVAFDLTQSATTVGGTWTCPAAWSGAQIFGFGIIASAVGGAQTTAATMGLFIGATAVADNGGNQFLVSSVASHAKFSVVEAFCNMNNSASGNTALLLTGPGFVFPTMLTGQLLTWQVVTAGVGSNQSFFPYVLAAPNFAVE